MKSVYMKLHLLRHAKTQAVAPSGRDFDRELLPKGIAQADEMGRFLNEKLSRKITVYCSSSARTKQTATLVQAHFEFRDIRFLDRLYHAELNTLLDFTWSVEGNDDILLIGHNEGISDLASYFTDKFISLKTCGYICIEFEGNSWKEASRGMGTETNSFRPEIEL